MQAVKNWIKRNFTGLLYGSKRNAAKKTALMEWLERFDQQAVSKLSDTSFDVFTYHGEDGIITYLASELKDVPGVFVDIGAGNCIVGNCCTQAIHFDWKGVFIEKDRKQLLSGKKFHRNTTMIKDLGFINEEISPENINAVIEKAGIRGEIGLLSIDIDGNDYWIWKAIDIIQPRIIVVEAKVEFGHHDVVVPYRKNNDRSTDTRYNGASVEAFRKLGMEKGYKLVGANRQGYNLFFIRKDEPMPEVNPVTVLEYPGTIRSFYPESFFNEHTFA